MQKKVLSPKFKINESMCPLVVCFFYTTPAGANVPVVIPPTSPFLHLLWLTRDTLLYRVVCWLQRLLTKIKIFEWYDAIYIYFTYYTTSTTWVDFLYQNQPKAIFYKDNSIYGMSGNIKISLKKTPFCLCFFFVKTSVIFCIFTCCVSDFTWNPILS